MILVTPCGVIDTTNFGKSEVNRQTIDFSLKFQEKKAKVEAKAEKEEETRLKGEPHLLIEVGASLLKPTNVS
ncbi:hypothetical protein FAC70_08890 [Campylobacter coli]|nr:hypothetical protein [Campylobacter coli]EAJ9349069.1 hypothetical protein [Campylobacter coli]ECR0855116.1 hypothetical protein [Campylobacter coli]EJO0336768.1 hypothetical protein [Campylobacter coli]EJP1565200.1 hypothetical protein [Campylobacter coli]